MMVRSRPKPCSGSSYTEREWDRSRVVFGEAVRDLS